MVVTAHAVGGENGGSTRMEAGGMADCDAMTIGEGDVEAV
jgi:hypothetical protein